MLSKNSSKSKISRPKSKFRKAVGRWVGIGLLTAGLMLSPGLTNRSYADDNVSSTKVVSVDKSGKKKAVKVLKKLIENEKKIQKGLKEIQYHTEKAEKYGSEAAEARRKAAEARKKAAEARKKAAEARKKAAELEEKEKKACKRMEVILAKIKERCDKGDQKYCEGYKKRKPIFDKQCSSQANLNVNNHE